MISYAVSGPMRSVGSPSTCTRLLQVVFAEQRVRPQRAIVALE